MQDLVGIYNFGYEFVKHVLYFVESAADSNEFVNLLLNNVNNAVWWGFI